MDAIILYARISKETAIKLATELDISAIDGYNDPYEDDKIPKLILRWGCASSILTSAPLQINTMDSIHLNIDKLSMRQKLKESGIRIPRFVTEPPCIWRPEAHSKSDGLEVLTTHEQMRIKTHGYFSEIINPLSEYRVFVFGDKILGVYKKHKVNPNELGETSGYRMKRIAITRSVKQIAIDSMRSIGLFMGAVDLFLDRNGLGVFECNSAPHLCPIMLSRFVQEIKSYYAKMV